MYNNDVITLMAKNGWVAKKLIFMINTKYRVLMIIALFYGQTLQWFLLLTRYTLVSNSYSSSASKIQPTKEFKSSEKNCFCKQLYDYEYKIKLLGLSEINIGNMTFKGHRNISDVNTL